ncbi:MAG: hypothetical protein IJ282_03085 [Lachnospiraceae bacterium]|nr:hypothetical protein [Lachnospiraceae bacterium]
MRISFEEHTHNVDRATNEYNRNRTEKTKRTDCYALDISGTVMDNTAYGVQGRTAEDVMREAAATDADVLRDYMTVMSNSMSEEDFAKLQKEGCSPMDTDIEEVVTIVDKIKAELAKAGVEVVGYTDTLDTETLTEIAGSETYAHAIENAFRKADVPMTKENVTEAVNAVNKAKELSVPTEGAEKYMLDNQLEPTIDDLYLAEFSGADRSARQAKGYYRDDTAGYYAKRAEAVDLESLKGQIEQIILREGLELNEENLKNAEFLLEKGIPVTGEKISLLGRIKSTRLPADEDTLWKAVAAALAEGKPAGDANLYDGRSVYEKAASADKDVDELLAQAESSGNVTRYRQLQEIRLMMTVDANVKLLKSGFSIDTGKLEELVDALKDLEQKQAENLFGASANPISDYQLYKESVAKAAALPAMPADVIGKVAGRIAKVGIDALYEEGLAIQKSYQEAQKSYEALMTAPRRDMGDNIQTAFRNVDNILADMGLSLTEENRRAVRILGYNSTEITPENLADVKAADRSVQRVVDKLTPAKVLQMIRDGMNPLETSLADVEAYLDGQESYDEEAQKYSKYLYSLEKSGKITDSEKESYIGIYRMLRQIEKSDGAVIGSLLESGAQITFANLLSAVRSSKVKGIDVSVDDNFGGLEALNTRGISITEQIAAGYTKGLRENLEKEITDSSYNKVLLDEVRKLKQITDGDLDMLKQMEIPVTVDYLLATSMLRSDRGSAVRKLWQKRDAVEELPKAMEHIRQWEEQLTDRDSAKASYQEYVKQLTQIAEELTFSAADTSIDVREMQLIHKQLHVAGKAVANEEYDIPVLLEDEMTAIHLTLRHEEEVGGRVFVGMESEKYGKLTAQMNLQEGKVAGFLTAESAETQQLLLQVTATFSEKVSTLGMEAGELPVLISGKNEDTERISEGTGDKREDTRELYQLARIFIRSLKENLV